MGIMIIIHLATLDARKPFRLVKAHCASRTLLHSSSNRRQSLDMYLELICIVEVDVSVRHQRVVVQLLPVKVDRDIPPRRNWALASEDAHQLFNRHIVVYGDL
jgi:hypothetical protein